MPNIRKTPQAYIIEPTFWEQLQQVLPSVIGQITQAQQRAREQELLRLQLRMKYTEADPEIQQLLRSDPEFVTQLTGKKNPRPDQIPPVRDLTATELQERRQRNLEEQKTIFETERLNADVLRLRQDYALTGRKLKAWEKIDNIPTDQLTLLDFIEAGAGETPEERAQAFVSKKYPEYADQIAQLRAGAGPEVERFRTNEAAQKVFELTGKLGPNEMAYAEAVGKNDLNEIQKLADGRLKTRAFYEYELEQKRDAEAVRRAQEGHKETIGAAAQRIIEQNPTVPLVMAQDMAKRLMEGKELTAEQAKMSIDWAGLKAETAAETLRKIRYDLDENKNGAPELKSLIDQHLRILAQEEGVDPEIKKWSGEQITKLMPELAKRVAQSVGLPPPQITPAEKGSDKFWGPDPVMSLIWGAVGLGMELALPPGAPSSGTAPQSSAPVERNPAVLRTGMDSPGMRAIAISARDVIGSLQNLGKTISPALEGALLKLDEARRMLGTTPGQIRQQGTPVKGPKPRLSEDQQVHMQNLALKVSEITADPNVSPQIKMKMGELLDLVEAVEKGERPFTDLFSSGAIPQ